jgi:ERO1-like protein beta
MLGQVTGPIANHPSRPLSLDTTPLGGALGEDAAEMCIYEHNGYDSERDYCIPEDESGKPEGVYVSLVNNPERFTGYAGDHAHAVWREIYRENCFELVPRDIQDEIMMAKSHLVPFPARGFDAAMGGNDRLDPAVNFAQEYDKLRLENTCLEKRVFWKLISGMHTSISTHICWDYLNQTTGAWVVCVKMLL